jgi:hypothetical protein
MELTPRKIIVIILLIFIIIFLIPKTIDLVKNSKDGINSANKYTYQNWYINECEAFGKNCDYILKDCSNEEKAVKNNCNPADIKAWNTYMKIKNCKEEDCNEDEEKEWEEFVSKYIKEEDSSNNDDDNSNNGNNDEGSEEDFFQKHKEQFESYANANNIDVNVIYSIILKEGAYNKDFEDTIRFECHKFNQYVGEKKVECTCNNNNYCTKEGQKSFSTISSETNYQAYLNAKEINAQAAFKSTSFGFAQIMGFNYINLGLNIDYKGGLEKLKSESLQIGYFFAFLQKNQILEPIREKDWESIAKKYNGAQYAQNNYHTDIKNNYETLTA